MEVGGAIASINTPLRLLAEVLFLDGFDVKVNILKFSNNFDGETPKLQLYYPIT